METPVMGTVASILTLVASTATSFLSVMASIITAALEQPLVQLFIVLGIFGIGFRYAKGLLSLR